MKKNKHNKETGSNIERSDERIKETQDKVRKWTTYYSSLAW